MGSAGRLVAAAMLATLVAAAAGADTRASPAAERAERVLHGWYELALELVRHTPTHSPPVASRSFGYLGVTAFEAAATGGGGLRSLAGQLGDLAAPPARAPGAEHDEAAVLHAALTASVRHLFANTGPAGQRAMDLVEARLAAAATDGLAPATSARSLAHGEAVAAHVLAWAAEDGGAVIENMGFPLDHAPAEGPARWVPTSLIAQQQAPLLPDWGTNRPFAMPHGRACPLPPPPAYDETPGSDFHAEALEVYAVVQAADPEQRAIARFWADDPMLSPTPPGHWIAIALAAAEQAELALADRLDLLARLGVALADSFIGCWAAKFDYDLLRPVTYIRRTIDPDWEPPLITPPFPEYPSGHSTQSGAAATVLTARLGEGFAFEDATHVRDGIAPRAFPSFWAAAEEAGISRLYGGIHFRAAIERGLEQGRCIGAFAAALDTGR
jgi:hypothetical protein